MKLNRNSVNAKFYQWFYDTSKLPNSICPYFWKLLTAWSLAIVISVFSLPLFICEVIRNDYVSPKNRLGMSIFLYMILGLLFFLACGAMMIFGNYDEKSLIFELGPPGVMIWLVLIIIGIIEGVKAIRRYLSRLARDKRNKLNEGKVYREYTEPQDSVIVSFLKSKYNKYCEKIEWF